MAFRLISLILSLSLLCQQAGIAYASGELNLANYLSSMRNAMVQPDVFQPARIRYISYDSRNNDFKLLLDKGDAKLNNVTQELFNYFLIGLALPNDTFWVNLRPDAPENIIDPLLEKTDIGKIFLEADLQLKKDTASLTSPQNPEGRQYWDKLYKKAGELFGTENITIPTITRPWIVPNEVIVRETGDSAYIYKATLKVMLESDYLIGRGGSRTAPTPDQYAFSDPRLKELNEYSSQIIRETIIPKLTREVNSSKRYAKLRQVYYSLVLARWFKQKYSGLGSAGASANSYLSLIDSGNIDNLISPEPCDKQTYFQAYQKSFKNGEYNLKETVASPSGQSIRNYISGGLFITSIPMEGVRTTKENPYLKSLILGNELLKKYSRGSGSPIEAPHKSGILSFWNHGNRNEESLEYARVNELGDNNLEAIVRYLEENKSSLPKKKMRQLEVVIGGIKQGDKDLLSRLRFALSEDGSFQGCVEILNDKEQGRFEVSPVIGTNQWVELAMIIAGIRELAGSMREGDYPIAIKGIWTEYFYIAWKLDLFNKEMLFRDYKDDLIVPSRESADRIIDGFHQDTGEQISNAEKQIVNAQEVSGLLEADFKEYLKSIKKGLDVIGLNVRSLPERNLSASLTSSGLHNYF